MRIRQGSRVSPGEVKTRLRPRPPSWRFQRRPSGLVIETDLALVALVAGLDWLPVGVQAGAVAAIEHIVEADVPDDERGLEPLLPVRLLQALAGGAVSADRLARLPPVQLVQALALPVIEHAADGGAADAAPEVPCAVGRLEDVMIHALLHAASGGVRVALEIAQVGVVADHPEPPSSAGRSLRLLTAVLPCEPRSVVPTGLCFICSGRSQR